MPDFSFIEPLAFGPVYMLLCGCLIINTLLFLPSITLLIRRCNHKVISHRAVGTLVPHLCFSYVLGAVQTLSILMGKEHFCYIVDFLYGAFFYFIMHFMMVTPNIVSHLQINMDKINEVKSPWTRRALIFTRPSVRLGIHFVVGTLHAIATILVYFFYTNLQSYGECNRAVILVFAITLAIVSVIIGSFITRLLFASDPYFLRLELFISMFIHFPTTILLSLLYGFMPQVMPDWFDYRWIIPMMNLPVVLVNAVFPLLLTNDRYFTAMQNFAMRLTGNFSSILRSKAGLAEEGLASQIDSLIATLTNHNADILHVIVDNEILLASFKNYCVKNWSVENLMFYMAVNSFKEQSNYESAMYESAMYESARHIRDNFIMVGSCTEINIDGEIRKLLVEQIKNQQVTGNMFDAAQDHISNLMRQDTMVAWQSTPEAQAAWQQVARQAATTSSSTKRLSRTSSNKGMKLPDDTDTAISMHSVSSVSGGSGSGSNLSYGSLHASNSTILTRGNSTGSHIGVGGMELVVEE